MCIFFGVPNRSLIVSLIVQIMTRSELKIRPATKLTNSFATQLALIFTAEEWWQTEKENGVRMIGHSGVLKLSLGIQHYEYE